MLQDIGAFSATMTGVFDKEIGWRATVFVTSLINALFMSLSFLLTPEGCSCMSPSSHCIYCLSAAHKVVQHLFGKVSTVYQGVHR